MCLDSVVESAEECTTMQHNPSDKLQMACHLLEFQARSMVAVEDVTAELQDTEAVLDSDGGGLSN